MSNFIQQYDEKLSKSPLVRALILEPILYQIHRQISPMNLLLIVQLIEVWFSKLENSFSLNRLTQYDQAQQDF